MQTKKKLLLPQLIACMLDAEAPLSECPSLPSSRRGNARWLKLRTSVSQLTAFLDTFSLHPWLLNTYGSVDACAPTQATETPLFSLQWRHSYLKRFSKRTVASTMASFLSTASLGGQIECIRCEGIHPSGYCFCNHRLVPLIHVSGLHGSTERNETPCLPPAPKNRGNNTSLVLRSTYHFWDAKRAEATWRKVSQCTEGSMNGLNKTS